MDTTTALTGVIPAILITSGVLTLILSLVLLWLYRRTTLREMARAAVEGDDRSQYELNNALPDDVQKNRAGMPEVVPLEFHDITNSMISADHAGKGNEGGLKSAAVLNRIRRSQKYTAKVYLAGGFAYALVLTLAWTVSEGGSFSVGRTLMLLAIFLWPTAIALCMITAIGIKEYVQILGGYALMLIIVFLAVLARNTDQTLSTYSILWLIINLPPSVFFMFFLQDRLRSVGPIIFTFILCGITGAFMFLLIAGNSDSALHTIVSVGQLFGFSATTMFVLILLTGFALFAIIGRLLLKMLGRAYNNKQCSDRSIILDSLWLMFAIIQSIGFAFEGTLWILTAPVAFIAYRLVASSGFRRRQSNDSTPDKPLELLLLRVFSLGRRSNRFYDKFSRLWRQVGVINMIAGPDLVTTTIEPHEFLDFAGGKLSRQFVVSERDLDLRISDRDTRTDPDGRYRVHEFFCHDNTWRMTMQKLAAHSDAILMDLRSFSSSNQGCLYELNILVDTIDLRRIVFVIDKTTDRDFLVQSFLDIWSSVDKRSPNCCNACPAVALFAAENHDRQTMKTIISHLLAHAHVSQRSSDNSVDAHRLLQV